MLLSAAGGLSSGGEFVTLEAEDVCRIINV